MVSERFCIGLLPWLDYSMLHRRSGHTDLMVVGIDFKHFPGFLENEKDHHLPLSRPQPQSNIWGATSKSQESNRSLRAQTSSKGPIRCSFALLPHSSIGDTPMSIHPIYSLGSG